MELDRELKRPPPGRNQPEMAGVAPVADARVGGELLGHDSARLVRGGIVDDEDRKRVEALREKRGEREAKVADVVVERDADDDARRYVTPGGSGALGRILGRAGPSVASLTALGLAGVRAGSSRRRLLLRSLLLGVE